MQGPPRGLWLLLFLPGSAGLAALLAPSSSSNQVPASRPFCRLFGFFGFSGFCWSVRSEGASVVKVEVVWHFVF